GDVERQRARGDRLHVERAHVAQLHQRALPELLLDLRDGRVQRLVARLRLFLARVPQVGLLLCHLSHLSVSWSSWAVGSSNSAIASYSAPVRRKWDLKRTRRVGRKNRNICSGSGCGSFRIRAGFRLLGASGRTRATVRWGQNARFSGSWKPASTRRSSTPACS